MKLAVAGGERKQGGGAGESMENAVKWLRMAVARMQSLNVPPTPRNFTVWFEYHSGRLPGLTAELDRLQEKEDAFTAEVNDDLYERFFGVGCEEQLRELHEAIRNLAAQLSEQLRALCSDMDGYEQVLAECELQLQREPNIGALRDLVTTLLRETRHARNTSQATSQLVDQLNAEIKILRAGLEQLNEEVLVDALTGVANRRSFDRELDDCLEASARNGRSCCLLLLDIDRFKRFNDQHGHLVGDRVLRFVAEMIKKSVKGRDLVARFGGEEFAVILPNTEFGGGMAVAQAIVETVANQTLIVGKEKRSLGNVTLSAGLSIYRHGDDAQSLIGRADDCLYSAKAKGRNQVVGERSRT